MLKTSTAQCDSLFVGRDFFLISWFWFCLELICKRIVSVYQSSLWLPYETKPIPIFFSHIFCAASALGSKAKTSIALPPRPPFKGQHWLHSQNLLQRLLNLCTTTTVAKSPARNSQICGQKMPETQAQLRVNITAKQRQQQEACNSSLVHHDTVVAASNEATAAGDATATGWSPTVGVVVSPPPTSTVVGPAKSCRL